MDNKSQWKSIFTYTDDPRFTIYIVNNTEVDLSLGRVSIDIEGINDGVYSDATADATAASAAAYAEAYADADAAVYASGNKVDALSNKCFDCDGEPLEVSDDQ